MPRILIDFESPDGHPEGALRHRFGEPVRVLQAHTPGQVRAVIDAVEQASQAGFWCVGFVTYEAATAFDSAFRTHAPAGPLAWFAVLDAPLPDEGALSDQTEGDARACWDDAPDRAGFDRALARIHTAILDGEVYQVNLTAPLRGALREGSGLALFQALRRAQPGGFAAYIDTGPMQVLSVSPELFFDWHAGRLLARPMKGTAPRGADPDEDRRLAEALRQSEKERAENLMIVDLIRNDLSRVAEPFSVQVPSLFALRPLPTVWQMTSDVTARTRPGARLADVFGALFPCGSITGAPKVRAMQLIREVESGARGVYCGAVGVVRPGGRATFNVAIRTVTAQDGRLTCGIGSGITSGATADGEWREWQHKRAFLLRAAEPFELLETFALRDGTVPERDAHLARMARAAAYFGYPWHAARVQACIEALCAAHPVGAWRVRLRLDASGTPRAEAFALGCTPPIVRLQLASAPLRDAHSEFVRFKTTRRGHYDAFIPTDPAIFDTLLWNVQGELTECTRGNVALRIAGQWITPALSSGLLDGVGRRRALETGRVTEAVLRIEDLDRADAVAFFNSLRGWIPAELAGDAAAQRG